MAELDISNVISVSLSATPLTMKQANLSTIALFTANEGPEPNTPYYIYRNPTAVGQDWGTDSEVYRQAVKIFAQTPNILTGNGYLIVIPLLPSVSIEATSGYAIQESYNLQNFRAVTDGSIKINIDDTGDIALTGLNFSSATTSQKLIAVFNSAFADYAKGASITSGVVDYQDFTSVENGSFTIQTGDSEAVEITGLDFSSITSLADIATVINTALSTADVPVTATADEDNAVITFETDLKSADATLSMSAGSTGTDVYGSSYLNIAAGTSADGQDAINCVASLLDGQLKFTSGSTGSDSSVDFASDTTGTDLSTIEYLDVATMVKVQGTNAYVGQERLTDALIRAKGLIFFNGVLVDYTLTTDELLDASDYIQTQSKMLFISDNDTNCVEEGMIFDRIKQRGNTHTRCIAYFGNTKESARLVASAYAGRGLCVDFDGSNTTLSMQLKDLTGCEPDPRMTETLKEKAKHVGADVYASIDGVPAVLSFGENDFFDNVYNDIWLKTALQVAGFNCLRSATGKIPQTQAGVATLISAYVDVLNRGIKNGAIAPGSWTRPDTFGDPKRLKESVASIGYYVYATPITEQSQEDREERKAPFIQMAIKRAGAIHSSNILVYINN